MIRTALALTLLATPAAAQDREAFNCVMDPSATVRLGAPVTGLLEAVLVSRGDRVEAGQIVAKLHSEIEAATIALYAETAANEAEIDAQAARLRFAQSQLERAQELRRRGVGTTEQLESAEAETEVTLRELAQAQMRRRIAGLELNRAKAQLAQLAIRSPIDGVVVDRARSAGEFMSQEDHVAIIAALDPLHVETFLPVEFYGRIQAGDVATVTPDAPVGGDYEAKVAVVDQVFDAASGTFGIRLDLPNPGGKLPAGHRCVVSFDVGGDG